MKIQLTQKHLAFIIVAISFIYLISCQKEASWVTSAKIIYTDIIPDTIVVSYGTYNLDLDKDGVYDFSFECDDGQSRCGGDQFPTYADWAYVAVKPAENSFNEVLNVVDSVFLDSSPAALDSLTKISSINDNWAFDFYRALKYYKYCRNGFTDVYEFGNWPNSIDKYLGLKLVKGTQAFYGWVRLNVQISFPINGAILILKDYAYNSSPNESILAGQKE